MAKKIQIRTETSSKNSAKKLKPLSEAIVSPADISQLCRELETLEDAITQLRIAKSVHATIDLPRVSKLLATVANEQTYDLKKVDERRKLLGFLQGLRKAPVIHMAFASKPSETTARQFVSWFRSHVHPMTLLGISLRPDILSGTVIRTNNKLFDFSGKAAIAEHRSILLEQIQKTTGVRANEQ